MSKITEERMALSTPRKRANAKKCTAHHGACDCREAAIRIAFRKYKQEIARLRARLEKATLFEEVGDGTVDVTKHTDDSWSVSRSVAGGPGEYLHQDRDTAIYWSEGAGFFPTQDAAFAALEEWKSAHE